MRDIRSGLACLTMAAIACLTTACGLGGSNSDGEAAGASQSPTMPTTVLSGPLATFDPNAGAYWGLTFEQAQQLVPFELIMPDPIPPAFEFVGADIPLPPALPPPTGTAYPADATMWGEPREVGFGFQPASGEEQALTFYESAGGGDRCPESPGTLLTIEATQVRKYAREDRPDGALVIYCWETHGLNINLTAIVGPDLPITERDLEELIAATVG